MLLKIKKALSKYTGVSLFVSSGFRSQLLLSFSAGIILLALITTFTISTLTNRALYARFSEEGERVTKVLSEQSILALLYQSQDNARDIVKAVLAFPDVKAVGIYDRSYQTLLETDGMQLPPVKFRKWPENLQVEYETADNWFYVAPVYLGAVDPENQDDLFSQKSVAPELLGYVRVLLSKQTLNAMTASLEKRNLLISSVLASGLLIFLLLITSRMTKPLKNLADIMRRADRGEYYIRAEVTGPRDIKRMEQAFNAMMQALEQREEELKRARDAAIESARIKGEFAANVTHELRTPMNGVLGMLELLGDAGFTAKQKEYIQIAKNSAEALLLLIDEVLDFSKMDAGKATLVMDEFNPRDMISEIVELLHSQANRKGLYLRYSIMEDVPHLIKSVPTRIRQILVNLIGNAIKFTEEGGVTIKLSSVPVEGSEHEIILKYKVIDTGIGIPKESQQDIFNPFHQVDGSTSRRYGGSGLGLAISSQLVNYLGGEIGVESEVEKGSRFFVSLPASCGEEKIPEYLPAVHESRESLQPVQSLVVAEPKSEYSRRKQGKILLVEDNITNQQVAIGLLERLGHAVVAASSGWEALDLFAHQDFDIVLMDVQMPGMDGYEVTARIRAYENKTGRKSIPVIAMTANTQASQIDHCFDASMNDFIGKPFKLYAIEEKIRHWLERESATDKQTQESGASTREGETLLVGDTAPSGPHKRVFKKQRLLDQSVLEELYSSVGEAFRSMVRVYLEDMPGTLDSMQKYLPEKNFRTVERLAHTLKSSARTFGAMQLAEMCRQMEDITREGNVDMLFAEALMQKIVIESGKVKESLEVIVGNFSSKNGEDHAIHADILLVDHQSDMRIMMRSMLEMDGYHVTEAESGEQALSQCLSKIPDLVIVESTMPGMDGFAVCRQILALPECQRIPVLIMTGLENGYTIEKTFTAGALDYIPKPVNFKVVRNRIARLLDASLAEKNVRHLVCNDPLTGLLNRAGFMSRLGQMIEESSVQEKLLAVMFVDIDRFKRINETLGHEAGDVLIQKISQRLSGVVRNSDVIARMGGDEFGIIVDRINSIENLRMIAEKISKKMAKPLLFVGERVYVTVNIGIAVFPHDGVTAGELVRFADTATHRAKEKQNGYQFYEQGMEKLIEQKMHMENELRRALKQDEFIIHYQPQMKLDEERITSMEALVRWQHPVRGMVPPMDFILLAEETGLISDLGEWVLRHACLQISEWLGKGYPALRFAVNLSGKQLEDPHLVEKILSILRETKVPAELLELEITESAIMENPDAAISVLDEIKRMGISLAIDDFGTGQSSLNYLRKFPVDVLKIDRSFVKDVTLSSDDAVLVKGIIALAKSLDLKVVAEGVETKEQKDFLKQCGCDFIQGYYLYRPLAADTFEATVFDRVSRVTNF